MAPEFWTDDLNARVKSVVCFLIAPALRGRGIATRLLERVCSDAVDEDCDYLEGYPPPGSCDMYAAHHGTIALFERCGFSVRNKSQSGCIMRKYL